MFGLLDMQEQVEVALSQLAPTLESTQSATILADFTQLYAMIRQEVRLLHSLRALTISVSGSTAYPHTAIFKRQMTNSWQTAATPGS